MTWNNRQNNNWNRQSNNNWNRQNNNNRGNNSNGNWNRQSNGRGQRNNQQSDRVFLKIGVSYLNQSNKDGNPFWSSMMFNFGESVLSDGTELSQDQCIQLVTLAIVNNVPVKTSYWEQRDNSLRGVASIDVTDLLQSLGDNDGQLEQEETVTKRRHVAVTGSKQGKKGQGTTNTSGRSPQDGQAKGQGRGLKSEQPAFNILSDEEEVVDDDESLF